MPSLHQTQRTDVWSNAI